MKISWMLILLSLLIATPTAAQEGTVAASAETPRFWRIGLGARIGGYGFRQVNDEGNLDFESCRMNGSGVFLTNELGKNVYTELAVDFYNAIAEPMQNGIDRISLHTTFAGGIKFFPKSLITPNVHIGGGAEWTSAEVYGARIQTIAPVVFIGAGGEINFGDLKAGLSIRSNAMQLPEYAWQNDKTVTWHTEVAGQALFWVRYVL